MIRNNVEGYEREVLERYHEPTWNYPVVRFVDGSGKDVIPRKASVFATGDLLARMERTLRTAKRDVPAWFDLTAAETSSGEVETALFAMT